MYLGNAGHPFIAIYPRFTQVQVAPDRALFMCQTEQTVCKQMTNSKF